MIGFPSQLRGHAIALIAGETKEHGALLPLELVGQLSYHTCHFFLHVCRVNRDHFMSDFRTIRAPTKNTIDLTADFVEESVLKTARECSGGEYYR
jgi:hypothetical protein